jgi:hypothetical protein
MPARRAETVEVPPLLQHLVGTRKEGGRDFEPERLGRVEVNDQVILDRRLHRKLGCLLALEDTVDVTGGASVLLYVIDTIGNQAARRDIRAFRVDRRQLVPDPKRDNEVAKMLRSGT